ncbi:hypothetical protein D3C75_1157160 [compost metagenome]
MPTRRVGRALMNWFQVDRHSLLPQMAMNRQIVAISNCESTLMVLRKCAGMRSVSIATAMCEPER